MTSTSDAPATTAAPSATGRRGLGFAVAGVILTLLGPVMYAIGGLTLTGGAAAAVITIGVVVQAAGAALVLAGVFAGVVALVRGARPVVLPVLAILGLPIGGILLLIEVMVIFFATT